MSGTKNDGEFEFDIQKLKKWVFLVGWRAKPENEQQIFRFSRFSRCENENSPRKFQGSLQTNRMGISASLSVIRCNAGEKETKTFPVFSTGKLLFHLACIVHAAAGFESRLAPNFFFFVFRFFFVFSMCRSFFRILFLPTPSKTRAVPASKVWHRWVTLSSSKPFFSIMSFLRGGWPVFSVFLQSPWFFTAVDTFSDFLKKVARS